jgi:hypothetical protein
VDESGDSSVDRNKFIVVVELDDESLADILVTAVEGGIGYWSECSEYQHNGTPGIAAKDVFAVIIDTEDPEFSGSIRIDLDIISRGIKNILAKDIIRKSALDEILRAICEDDVGMIDADYADCIIQAGLWGELRYG